MHKYQFLKADIKPWLKYSFVKKYGIPTTYVDATLNTNTTNTLTTVSGKIKNFKLHANLEQVSSILPDGYTQVDYIESSGTQYINVNYEVKSNTKVEVDFKSNKTTGQSFTTLFGTQNSANEGRFYFMFGSANNYQVNLPRNSGPNACLLENGNVAIDDTPATGTYWTNERSIYTLDITNKVAKINNKTWDLSSLTGNYVAPINVLMLLTRNNAGTADSNRSRGLLYGTKIYEGTTLVRNMIPCYRNSDNEVGLYDLVNDVFYTNEGTRAFTYGSIASIPNPDYPIDIHTISGDVKIKIQNKNIFTVGNIDEYETPAYNITMTNDTITGKTVASAINYVLKTAVKYGNKITILSETELNNTSTYVEPRILVRAFDSNGDRITNNAPVGWTYNSYYKAFYNGGNILTFNMPSASYVNVGFVFYGGGGNDYLKYKNIMVTTLDATVYEPHKEQSLPLNLSVLGKNLFDITAFEKQLVAGKILNDNGVEISDAGSTYSKYKIPVKANQNYYIKGAFQRIYYYDENGNFLSRGYASNGKSMQYSPTENGFIGFQIPNNYWASYKGQEQVEIGTSATSYEPYILPEYCGIGDYEDEFVYNTTDTTLEIGKWYLKKNVGKVVLDGSENWSLYLKTFNCPNLGTGKPTNALCNSFINKGENWVSSDESNRGKFSMNNTENSFKCMPLTDMTLEQWITYVSANNIIAYYSLANPTYILLNDTLQSQLNAIENNMRSYKDKTNITVKTNINTTFDLSYKTIDS